MTVAPGPARLGIDTSTEPPCGVAAGMNVVVPAAPVTVIGPPVYWTVSGSVMVPSRPDIGFPTVAGAGVMVIW